MTEWKAVELDPEHELRNRHLLNLCQICRDGCLISQHTNYMRGVQQESTEVHVAR